MYCTASHIGDGHGQLDDPGTGRCVGALNGVCRWVGEELAVGCVDGRGFAVKESGRLAAVRFHGRKVCVSSAIGIRDFPTHQPDGIGSAQGGGNEEAGEILHVDSDLVVLRVRFRNRRRLDH